MSHPTALRFRDAAAAAAFASVAVSRELPLWLCVLFAAGTVLALLGYRPLSVAPVGSLFGVLLIGAALYVQVFSRDGDLVVAACGFAGLLLLQRLLCPPVDGTEGQIQLIGLLLVAGGAALSGELLFAVCLIVYVLLAFLSLGHALLGRSSREERSAASWRLLGGGLLATLGAVALFALFPRLSWNVAAQRLPKSWSRAEAGLSDRIRLQAGGALKTNPRVVFKSRLKPDPGGELLDRYWVAHVFTHFNGRDWYGEPKPARPPAWELEWSPRGREDIVQEIEVSPAMGSSTLPMLETPSWAGEVRVPDNRDHRYDRLLPLAEYREGEALEVRVLRAPPGTGFRFMARSHEGSESASGSETQNLQLPDRVDSRVEALARRLAGDTKEPLEVAGRLARYLRRELAYTLDAPEAVPADPLADFLFVRRAGHCEHFATALTVMLRTLGFEARVATGFYGGTRNASGQYQVRAGDAHAWTQVRAPGRGFVTVDATPESFRSASPAAWKDFWVAQYEQLMELWRSRVLDYSFRDQAEWATRWTRDPGAEAPVSKLSPGLGHRPRLKTLAGILAGTALAVWVGVRLLRGRRQVSRLHPAAAAWGKLELRIARTAGSDLRRLEGETSSEWVERVASRLPSSSVLLRSTERRYREARFGRRPLSQDEVAAWGQLFR